MYNPDRVFISDLKRLDPRLDCYYETAHEHFVVTYKRPIGDAVPVLLIETEDGGFRQPDRRDIVKLKEADTHRVDGMTRVRQAAQYMEAEREKTKRQARENIRNMTKDDKLQLAPRAARLTGGKHNSTFRRINLKSRGKTVDELQKATQH